MSKVKMKRHGFRLDMTPMVDVGFLLLTFFMLTAKFKSQTESDLDIKLPVAIADTAKLPDLNIGVLTIGVNARNDTMMYFGIANVKDRSTVYKSMNVADTNGKPITQGDELAKLNQVPVSKAWLPNAVKEARLQNPSMRFAIDADKRISYGYVDDVMRIMQQNGASRFNLVTISGGKEE